MFSLVISKYVTHFYKNCQLFIWLSFCLCLLWVWRKYFCYNKPSCYFNFMSLQSGVIVGIREMGKIYHIFFWVSKDCCFPLISSLCLGNSDYNIIIFMEYLPEWLSPHFLYRDAIDEQYLLTPNAVLLRPVTYCFSVWCAC